MILQAITSCKNLVRTGWMQSGVPPSSGDTVASHSFEAAILAYYLATELSKRGVKVNPDHASAIALFHDLGESLLGDLPKWASQRINKREAELEAFKEIGVGEDLFAELKNGETMEAKIAKLSDRLSTCIEAKRLIKRGYSVERIVESYMPEIERILSDPNLSLLRETVNEMLS